MSRDIRSFFKVISKSTGSEAASKPSLSLAKKKPKRLIDSDDEDVIASTPEQKPKIKNETIVLSSDSNPETVHKSPKKPVAKKSPSKLKPVNITDIFKKTPIKQSKVEVSAETPAVTNGAENGSKRGKNKGKKKKNLEQSVHNDSDFERTLQELDDDAFDGIEELLDRSEALEPEPNVPENQPKTERKRTRTNSSSEDKTPKKKKLEHSDSGMDPGQEAHEKKRYSAMLYQKYLNRSGPKHHGVKEYPKGKPDCLKNLCFLKTGVLDSLESEEFENLIKSHGGRVVHAVSKKVNYVVAGEDAGPAKLAKAESYGIPQISEDELLDMILKKSGMELKFVKKYTSGLGSSDNLDIESETEGTNKQKIDVKTKVETMETETKPEQNGTPKSSIKVSSVKAKHSTSNAETIKPKCSTSKDNVIKSVSAPQSTNSNDVYDDSLSLPLTEKYKPQNLRSIIGQQSDGSNLYKLKHWLENWHKNQNPQIKKKLVRPSPWAKKDDGAYFKCALLSGPPGVGKTTSATLVAKELGLDVVEFNASDTRSKRLLHEEVSQLLTSNTIAGYATGQGGVTKNRVLLMDEVDGMAGNEDRGGIQELIQLIKTSSIPIICMCNDRNHQKMRSLVNYCYDLKFTKPRLEQIRGAMMSICFKEYIRISAKALGEIIGGAGCDVRQTLNNLSVLASTDKEISSEVAAKGAKASKKDTIMGPWEVCRAVFTKSEHEDMTLADKTRLFFYDYSLGPLFVQENYLKVQPDGNCTKDQRLLKAAFAADSISCGDLIDAKIRRSNNWSLLESQAFFSSVMPGHYMSGHFTGQINFPKWLGKNSKKNKFSRLHKELRTHMWTSTCASNMAVKLDYLVPLKNAIISPLQKRGMEGIDEAVGIMKAYNLLREDLDNLLELSQWKRGDNPMNKIETKVKSAFTRAYNKQVTLQRFAPVSAKKRRAADLEGDTLEEDADALSENEDDDISNNPMIKIKKKAKVKKVEEAGTSKKPETKKKRGKKTT